MSGRVRWVRGGEAFVERLVGDVITLRSTVPSPPGSRIEGTLDDPPAVVVRVKVHVSRKVAEGKFEIHARLLDATREVMERLALEAGTAAPGS
jgi:hypothetical protein